ncbi:glucosamine-6-phosphate deaminase [Williamsia sp.]|uniref:glucosamine-6-phosphate deaminase n=1 Tax=Williamsia sp. TaxID=1872085 RepID=UPI002F936B67
MEIVIVANADAAGTVVADIVDHAVRSGATTLGLATGSSPQSVYRELARRHRDEGLTFAGLQAFLLDEYIGLPEGHPESYAQVIRRDLVDHLDLDADRVLGPDGAAADPFATAIAYDEVIVANGPVDVQILGIGANGHIGFNEPTSSLKSRTWVTTLSEQTRRDNARFFESPEDVPRHAITQGLGTICDARYLVLIATGEHKATAIAAAVEGPLAAVCPASVLQMHPHATVVVDSAAASRLRLTDFYKTVADHKLQT